MRIFYITGIRLTLKRLWLFIIFLICGTLLPDALWWYEELRKQIVTFYIQIEFMNHQVIVGMLASAVTGFQDVRVMNPDLVHTFPGLRFHVGEDSVSF